uniref:Uncharacterized protein n=1 Tax=Hyaloperonospora arabidopsidis (strain Emoy2) TaxID=559515 RepID=M4BI87_HYAAE
MATLESHNDYFFTSISVEERLRQTVGQPLASWIVAPAAATPEEVEGRRATESWPPKKTMRLYAGCIQNDA